MSGVDTLLQLEPHSDHMMVHCLSVLMSVTKPRNMQTHLSVFVEYHSNQKKASLVLFANINMIFVT